MTDALSLGPVLDLIERWQQDVLFARKLAGISEHPSSEIAMLDIPALRAQLEQHAAQLRVEANYCTHIHAEKVNAAANFLCAPRREPEAE